MVDLSGHRTHPATEPPFPAVQVANTFIYRFGEVGQIDHLKLQKLTYFAYGWWLALSGEGTPLSFSKPQVWKFGPVFQPIYNAFAASKSNVITTTKPISPWHGDDIIIQNDTYPSKFLDWIWSRYGQFKGVDLSSMTHAVGTPWYETAKRHGFIIPRFCEMSDDEIRSYFRSMAVKEGFISELAS